MAGAQRNSRRRNGELCRDCEAHRLAEIRARGGAGVCRKRPGGRDSLPSGRTPRRRTVRLSLGRRTQARVARAGGESMNARDQSPMVVDWATVSERSTSIDWQHIAEDLDQQGTALIERLLASAECEALRKLYPKDEVFRSRVVMERHGFGRGEYKYFSYPLPDIVADLRATLYPRLASIANQWNTSMDIEVRFPETHAAFIKRCHAAGQSRPTPLLLQYGAGDYNCLHQDLYGEHVFPLQAAFLLSRPNDDFAGGEFVLTE